MKNLTLESQLKIRLFQLNNRYERLIQFNRINRYVSMILFENGLICNPKTDQYLRLIENVKSEKISIINQIREINAIYSKNLEVAKNNLVTMTREMMYNLNLPSCEKY